MKWILIILTMNGGITSAEFDSKAACEATVPAIYKNMDQFSPGHGDPIRASVCVPSNKVSKTDEQ